MIPLIVGMSGTSLTAEEKSFFREIQPWGYILFKRNCVSSEQVRALTDELRGLEGYEDTPILIDQEGGRVARLKDNPEWRSYPSGGFFGNFYQSCPDTSLAAVRVNASLQAAELRRLGINVNCAPMIDVRDPASHDIIGDRAFSTEAAEVAAYGRAVMQGLMTERVLPVVKHIPGHGRARADSHEDLPVVEASLAELEKDFIPFRTLNDAPLAMTAHILYSSLDRENCATLSSEIIQNIIRARIGFQGILMSDDLSMKALRGDLGDLAENCLTAGCDLVLHCNGEMPEMTKIAARLPAISDELSDRTANMFDQLDQAFSPRSEADLSEEYTELAALMQKLGKAAA